MKKSKQRHRSKEPPITAPDQPVINKLPRIIPRGEDQIGRIKSGDTDSHGMRWVISNLPILVFAFSGLFLVILACLLSLLGR